MWQATGYNLIMTEDDFGIELPFEIQIDDHLGANDMVRIVIKDTVHGEDLIVKEFSQITGDTVRLVLTEQDSAKLPIGNYVYRLEWYQNGSFMGCLIDVGGLKVVKKV